MNNTNEKNSYKTNNKDENIYNELKQLDKFSFLPNKGNLGDVLIAASEFQYLEANCFDYKVYQRSKPFLYQKPFNLVYGGGGIWIKNYKNNYAEILEIFKSPYLKKCVILPSSFYDCDEVLDLLDERFTVFVRELQSYEYIKNKNSKVKLYLADDMAISCDFSLFYQNFYNINNIKIFVKKYLKSLGQIRLIKLYKKFNRIRKKAQIKAGKTAYILRTDSESNYNIVQDDAFDLSDFCKSCCCDSAFAFILTKLFLAIINKYNVIITDRLHVGIAAAKLGKKVYLIDNSYKKISSVYNYSLAKNFKNVQILQENQEINEFFESQTVPIDDSIFTMSFFDFVINYGSIINKYNFERSFL